MAYAQLLHQIPEELRRLYRNYEVLEKKIIQNEWSKRFNEICLQEGILPNFTRIRHHDPAVGRTKVTHKYRYYLLEREIEMKKKNELELQSKKEQCKIDINSFCCDQILKNNVSRELDKILENSYTVAKVRTIKKLNSLYLSGESSTNGKGIFIKEAKDSFVNLSNYELNDLEKEFLNLGINCHIQPKYDKLQKQVELEILYQNLTALETKNKVSIKPEIVEQLKSESTKHRNPKHHSSILSKPLLDAARNLKNNENIVVRKADKSSTYVILNKEEYEEKMHNILSDSTKFKRIEKDPTDAIKKKANNLIEAQNSVVDDFKLKKIVGDFQPGYAYGNVKTHKNGNPLRPIISQVPTPTYQLAKTLNQIITPYIPKDYMLNSTNDFIDVLQANSNNGIIASLDVESLFTNVPIDETIDIITEHSYNHPTLPPPKIPKDILKELLCLCTREAPFRCPKGNLYIQTEGVAMGSPLGPTFANFYMGNLEQQVFKDGNNKPHIYARYVDDIFVQIKDIDELQNLQQIFQENSVLNFTYEMNVNSKLPFLDVLVDATESEFRTKVYRKPTSQGNCLNGKSECTDKYKHSVISSYLNRAYNISDNWIDFHEEVVHTKQLLVNNNFSNTMVDHQIKKFLEQKLSPKQHKEGENTIQIYYQGQTHKNYKLDERIIENIVKQNTKCIDPNNKLKLSFYYRNKKTSNYIMKNNMTPPPTTLQKTNVVYKFTCPLPHSQAVEYVGMTQTKLSRRLTCHGQNGSILKHFQESHNCKPTRDQITSNTTIIDKENDRYKLAIKEALIILNTKPLINKQFDNFSNILKLYSLGNSNNRANNVNTNRACIESIEALCIPDMETVLRKFGVTINILENSPEIEYSRWEHDILCDFEYPVSPTEPSRFVDPSISQRIKSMTRQARKCNKY